MESENLVPSSNRQQHWKREDEEQLMGAQKQIFVRGWTQEFVARVYIGTGHLRVDTSRGEMHAHSGDVILEGPTGEILVLSPQTAFGIFGSDIAPLYRETPEFLGLSPAQINDLSSPTHGEHIPADIALVRSSQESENASTDRLPADDSDPATGEGTDNGGLPGGADSGNGSAGDGSNAAAPVETEEARRLREGLEKARAFQSSAKA